MVNGGDGPLVAALRNDPVDGPRALEMLKRPGTFKADDEEAKAFFLIFGQMFSDAVEVRTAARTFLTEGKRPPVVFINRPEVVEKLSQDGDYNKWMVNELLKGNICALEAWSVTIKLSGAIIHMSGSGTIILNSLLQVVEKAFKHPKTEIRKATYQAWMTLMDNFAEDPSILCSPKRIKLITRPLIGVISHRTEEQIRTKFDAWWHYLGLFKENLASNVDQVVLPFLDFCYKNLDSGKSVSQSPAKKFAALRSLCLEAMAILFCGLNSVKASQISIGPMLDCLKDGAGVVKAGGFVKQHQVLLPCVSEAFSLMRFNSKSEVGHMSAICQTLGSIAKDLCMASSEVNKDAVNNFLQTSLDMLFTLEREIANDEHGSTVSLALTIIDTISKLPTAALVSRKMLPSQTVPLSITMIQTLLRPNLSAKISSQPDSERTKYNAIFERFVSPYGQQRMDGLYILHDILNLLSECKFLKEGHHVTLWKIVAGFFEQHLLKFGAVNQAKNVIEVDLTASQCVLLFPFIHFPGVVSKQAWNQWITLFKQIVEKAETTQMYQTLFLENYLATQVLETLLKKQITSDEYSNLCRNLCESIVPSLKIQIQSQSPPSQGNSEQSLDKGKAVVQFMAHLASLAPELLKDKSSVVSVGQSCRSLCKQMSLVLDTGSSRAVLQELLELLSPAMATLIDNKLLSSLGPEYQFQAEALFDKAVNVLQARYDGHFTLEFLAPVQPFLVCALSHPKSKISTKGRCMWEITWGKKLAGKTIPPEIAACLKSSSFTDLSSSSSQDSPATVVNTPTSFRSSFLDRAKSPKFVRPSPKPSSAKKPAKNFFNLEEDNSSDFVKISPASKKRRPLTEHQKEKLTTRSDDIPALYSEVSRDETSLTKYPSQFDSQASMDESSMTAMDATDVNMSETLLSEERKVPDTKENEALMVSHDAKRKRLHPNKVVVPPKKRGRKRKNDERDEKDETKSTTAVVTVPAATATTVEKSQPPIADIFLKSRRGRPRKNGDMESDLEDKSQSLPKSPEKESKSQEASTSPMALSKITSQLKNTPLVSIQRMNIAISPVRIVQEQPFIFEATSSSQPTSSSASTAVSVARKIKFSDTTASATDKPAKTAVTTTKCKETPVTTSLPTPLLTNGLTDDKSEDVKCSSEERSNVATSDDEDVIESSQSSSNESADSKRKQRKRKIANNTIDGAADKSASVTKRTGARRSGNFSQTGNGDSSSNGSEEKENSAPQKEMAKLPRNKHGETELHTAVKKKNMERVRELLASGFLVDVKDYFGWTPLHESINDDPTSFEIMKVLVEHGALVNAKSNNGMTPLHDAIRFLSQELVDYLVEKGADPHIPDDNGQSAYNLAPSRFKNDEVAVESVAESEEMISSQDIESVTESEEPIPTQNTEAPQESVIENDMPQETGVTERPTDAENVTQVKSDAENVTMVKIDLMEEVLTIEESQPMEEKIDNEVEQQNLELENVNTSNDIVMSEKQLESTETAPKGTVGKIPTVSVTPTKPLIKPPLPFSGTKMSRPASVLSSVSRGARFLEMSKAKSLDGSSPSVTSPSVVLMSPKPEAEMRTTGPCETDLLTTPTQSLQKTKPWQKYAPSPMDASPSAGILKRTVSEKSELDPGEDLQAEQPPPCKMRRVQFRDPPVSDQVEIPRCPSGKATRQRLNDSKFNTNVMFLPKHKINFAAAVTSGQEQTSTSTTTSTETDSVGTYEATPTLTEEELGPNPNCLYPSLVNCDEPLVTIIPNLANKPWISTAEKRFAASGITKISDLSKMTKVKAHTFDQVLKAPDSVTTIREALRKFEKTLTKREKEKIAANAAAVAAATAANTNVAGPVAEQEIESESVEMSVCKNASDVEDISMACKKTGIASIVEESTPEEEDETMRRIYDRPSPSPTEELALKALAEAQQENSIRATSPPPIISEPIQAVDMPAPKPLSPSVVIDKEIQCSTVVKNVSTQNEVDTATISSQAVTRSSEQVSQCDEIPYDVKLNEFIDIIKNRPRNEILNLAKQLIDFAMPKE